MHTRIYIDASRSIRHGSSEKAEQAIKMAAAIAYLSVSEMDKVSVYAVSGKEVREVISGIVGKDAFLSSIGKLNEIEFTGDVSFSDAILSSRVGMGDGYSVIISDFLTDEDYERAIDHLAEKKRDILLVQILSRDELNPQWRGKMHLYASENPSVFWRKKIDKERIAAYRAALEYVTDKIKSFSLSRGGQYLLVPAYAPLGDVFFGQLTDLGVLK
jgi:uncharacterized protein (DUF58 family)